MPFKNQDLGWIRVNFKKEEDKALRDFASKTNLAPVDWYEDLDEETKESYNKNVLDKTANTYSAIYKFSPEEEQVYRDRFDIDYTAYIKDPIEANELHKKIMEFIQELIGDYRWDEWKTKMNLNEDIDQRKIKSWALFSDSILEKVYQKVTKEDDLDYLWNQMSRKAVSDDQQFAIDYFYNYRKMELGLDYNNELIGKMELKKDINELKEAALGFKPDATSRARASVETMMSNLDKTMEYLQGNAFVKTYKEEDAAKIKELTNVASDVIGDLLGLIDSTPDTKAKGMDEIRLKNYKPLEENSTEAKEEALKEKIRRAGKIFRDPDTNKDEKAKVEADIKSYKKELDSLKEEKTWADTFGDRAQKLADKQRDFAMGVKYRVEYTTQDGEKAKSRVYSSKDEAEKKEADLVNSGIKQAKIVKVEESINEDRESEIKNATLKAFEDWYDPKKSSPSLFDLQKISHIKMDRVQSAIKNNKTAKDALKAIFKGIDLSESVNENIETLLSPEDLKYYRAHRDEIEDILNGEFRSSKLSAKDAVEKHKAMKEGSCGYNTDAKTGKKLNTPGGLEERIKTLVREFTKQK